MSNCPVCNGSNRPAAHFCAICRAPLLLQNKYRITRLLGRGGYGAVYLAEQAHLGNVPGAVKELLPDPLWTPAAEQQAAAQFRFEANILAQLGDPALPKVTDSFNEGGRYYLVMEFVPGETLEEKLARLNVPLPESEVVDVAEHLCDVLVYLHSRQPPVIHRDVKPSNVKITPDGKLKLIDFGIAKLSVAGTKTAARAVSPPYSPLEQYGTGTDARSDIYALGVTLYQLATNALPPESPDRPSKTVILPSRLNPAISSMTESVILRAMEQDPANRFQSAAEMKSILRMSVTASSTLRAPRILPYAAAMNGFFIPSTMIPLILFGLGMFLFVLVLLASIGGRELVSLFMRTATPQTLAQATASTPPQVTQMPPNTVTQDRLTLQPSIMPSVTLKPLALPTLMPSVTPFLPPAWIPSATSVARPLPVDTRPPAALAVAEDFSLYTSSSQLQSVYLINAAWGTNRASINPDNRRGISGLRLDYDISGNSASDNYVVLNRSFSPAQNWFGAHNMEIWVENDAKPKQLILQFGEGRSPDYANFSFEVWHAFIDLSSNQSGTLRVPLSRFDQELGWAPSVNNRMDLDTVGYFALGIRGSSIGNGTVYFGSIRLLP